MSKIVVLVGSMRKGGNTDLLAQAFTEGASRNNDVEIVSVADYKVNPCIGCNSCFTRKENKCFQNDDMSVIYEKLRTADIVVIASPVYFYGVSAQLKAIIDRLHTPMRNEFQIKKLALLLVGAASLPNLFDAIKLQYQLVLDFFHLENAGMVLVRGVKDIGDIEGNEALKEAYELGLSIGLGNCETRDARSQS
ncbi:MAG: flavodoxin family protein [Bacteroides sp.]